LKIPEHYRTNHLCLFYTRNNQFKKIQRKSFAPIKFGLEENYKKKFLQINIPNKIEGINIIDNLFN